MVERAGVTRRVLSLTLGAVLAMTACSSEEEPPATEETQGASAMEKLSGDQFCELLPSASIEQALATTVEGSESKERGRAPAMESPYFLTRECDYETAAFGLSTEVTTEWDEGSTDEDVLDGVFTDPTGDSAAVGRYEPVPDLGDLAGFGPDSTLAEADVAGAYLGVVFHVGEERMSLTVHALGKAELAQLRPLAEELLAGVEEALG